MDSRAATTADLAKVFRNLADRMLAEYQRAGATRQEAKQLFRSAIDQGHAHALLVNDRPLAIISWSDAEEFPTTSFAAIEEFFDRRYLRFSKGHLTSIQTGLGRKEVHSHSWSLRDDTSKWFRLLGFDGPYERGDHKLYILPTKQDYVKPKSED